MKKLSLILLALVVGALLLQAQVGTRVALGIIEAVNYVDYNEVVTPTNPASGDQRWFASLVTHRMACITSTGADCTTTPSGAITLTLAAACPGGFTQVTALDGKMPLGTLTAHGDVGSTGGNDNLTSSFTGDTMPGHQHETPFMIDDGALVVGVTKSSIYGVGLDMPGYVQQLNNDGVTTSGIGSALTEDVSAGTPTGTNSTEDNRSAFVRVLFCSKN